MWDYTYLSRSEPSEWGFINFSISKFISGMTFSLWIRKSDYISLLCGYYGYKSRNFTTVMHVINIIIYGILNDRGSTVICLAIRQKIGLTYQPVPHKSVRISLFMALDIFHSCCPPQTVVRMGHLQLICGKLNQVLPVTLQSSDPVNGPRHPRGSVIFNSLLLMSWIDPKENDTGHF